MIVKVFLVFCTNGNETFEFKKNKQLPSKAKVQ